MDTVTRSRKVVSTKEHFVIARQEDMEWPGIQSHTESSYNTANVPEIYELLSTAPYCDYDIYIIQLCRDLWISSKDVIPIKYQCGKGRRQN